MAVNLTSSVLFSGERYVCRFNEAHKYKFKTNHLGKFEIIETDSVINEYTFTNINEKLDFFTIEAWIVDEETPDSFKYTIYRQGVYNNCIPAINESIITYNLEDKEFEGSFSLPSANSLPEEMPIKIAISSPSAGGEYVNTIALLNKDKKTYSFQGTFTYPYHFYEIQVCTYVGGFQSSWSNKAKAYSQGAYLNEIQLIKDKPETTTSKEVEEIASEFNAAFNFYSPEGGYAGHMARAPYDVYYDEDTNEYALYSMAEADNSSNLLFNRAYYYLDNKSKQPIAIKKLLIDENIIIQKSELNINRVVDGNLASSSRYWYISGGGNISFEEGYLHFSKSASSPTRSFYVQGSSSGVPNLFKETDFGKTFSLSFEAKRGDESIAEDTQVFLRLYYTDNTGVQTTRDVLAKDLTDDLVGEDWTQFSVDAQIVKPDNLVDSMLAQLEIALGREGPTDLCIRNISITEKNDSFEENDDSIEISLENENQNYLYLKGRAITESISTITILDEQSNVIANRLSLPFEKAIDLSTFNAPFTISAYSAAGVIVENPKMEITKIEQHFEETPIEGQYIWCNYGVEQSTYNHVNKTRYHYPSQNEDMYYSDFFAQQGLHSVYIQQRGPLYAASKIIFSLLPRYNDFYLYQYAPAIIRGVFDKSSSIMRAQVKLFEIEEKNLFDSTTSVSGFLPAATNELDNMNDSLSPSQEDKQEKTTAPIIVNNFGSISIQYTKKSGKHDGWIGYQFFKQDGEKVASRETEYGLSIAKSIIVPPEAYFMKVSYRTENGFSLVIKSEGELICDTKTLIEDSGIIYSPGLVFEYQLKNNALNTNKEYLVEIYSKTKDGIESTKTSIMRFAPPIDSRTTVNYNINYSKSDSKISIQNTNVRELSIAGLLKEKDSTIAQQILAPTYMNRGSQKEWLFLPGNYFEKITQYIGLSYLGWGKYGKDYYAYSSIEVPSCLTSTIEDIVLVDASMNRELKVRYNPDLTNLKRNYIDTITPTLGSQYPVIRRSGSQLYYTFNIGGLISREEIPLTSIWFTDSDRSIINSVRNDPYQQKLITERLFRDHVLEFLNNDHVKFFYSPQEGAKLIRLTNISLTPDKQLARLIYSFTAQATEVAPFSLENLVKYGV